MLQSPVLSSTFFLTLLMMIGLVFFIRASTKERLTVIQLAMAQPQELCSEQLNAYFTGRSYCLIETDPSKHKQVLEGMVRPSVFLAVLLFFLAGIGCLCLGLVLALLLPQWTPWTWGVIILAPLSSVFYWKKSSRVEQVSFKVEALAQEDTTVLSQAWAGSSDALAPTSKVTVMGHRDELASLQEALSRQDVAMQRLDEAE